MSGADKFLVARNRPELFLTSVPLQFARGRTPEGEVCRSRFASSIDYRRAWLDQSAARGCFSLIFFSFYTFYLCEIDLEIINSLKTRDGNSRCVVILQIVRVFNYNCTRGGQE